MSIAYFSHDLEGDNAVQTISRVPQQRFGFHPGILVSPYESTMPKNGSIESSYVCTKYPVCCALKNSQFDEKLSLMRSPSKSIR